MWQPDGWSFRARVGVLVPHAAVERHAQEVLVRAELLVRHDARRALEHARSEQRVPGLLEAGRERGGAAADVRDADRGRRLELELQLADRTEQAVRSIGGNAEEGALGVVAAVEEGPRSRRG